MPKSSDFGIGLIVCGLGVGASVEMPPLPDRGYLDVLMPSCRGPTAAEADNGTGLGPTVVRQAVTIPSDSETLQWLAVPPSGYQPGNKLPGIVTANALTGVKEINLAQYAERFAAAGFATLVFDYRYWGQSSGDPRFHIAPMEFRADIRAALDFLASRPEVDANRIGGWGISMGGQNMLFLATWEPRFKAIVAVATGIEPPVEGPPLSPEAAKAKYDDLVAASEKELAGRAAAGITTLQAWCPQPQDGCALPVKEAFDWYEQARASFAPMFENKLTARRSRICWPTARPSHCIWPASQFSSCNPIATWSRSNIVLFYFKRAPEPKRLIIPGGLHTSTYVGGGELRLRGIRGDRLVQELSLAL